MVREFVGSLTAVSGQRVGQRECGLVQRALKFHTGAEGRAGIFS